jgi:hypothetical protein
MTALTQETSRVEMTNYGVPIASSFDVAASTRIFNGALVALDSAGRAVNAAAGVVGPVVGVAMGTADNSAGAAGALKVRVRHGVFPFTNSSGSPVVRADLFTPVYAEDNDTVATSNSGTLSPAGVLVNLDDTAKPYVLVSPWATSALPGQVRTLSRRFLFSDIDVDVAATSMTYDFPALPSGAIVLATGVALADLAVGPSVTNCILKLGTAADDDGLITTSSLFAAAVDGQASTKTAGVAVGSSFSAKTLRATITATGANLGVLTALDATLTIAYTVPV